MTDAKNLSIFITNRALNNQQAFEQIRVPTFADHAGFLLTTFTELEKFDPVFHRIKQLQGSPFQFFQFGFRKGGLEDGFLDPNAIALHQFGDAVQSSIISNVVGDQINVFHYIFK